MTTAPHVKITSRSFPATFTVGSTPTAAFDFQGPFWVSTDILVYVDGVLVDAADYTVTGLYEQDSVVIVGAYGGGTVTLDTAVSSCTLVIDRFVPAIRDTDLPTTSPLDVNAVNSDLDRLVAGAQDLLAYAQAHAGGGGGAITPADVTGLLEYVQDTIGAAIVGGTNVTATYNDAAGTVTVAAAGGGGGGGGGDMFLADNLAGLASTTTARANLGVAIGSNVQAYSAILAAIAGLAAGADKLPYFTGASAAAVTTLSSFARTLLDDADAATMRATLGVGSGTGDMVAANNLSDLASASTARTNLGLGALAIKGTINNADWSGTVLAVTNGGTGAANASAARTNLGLAIGTDVQAYSVNLAAIAGLTSAADKLGYFTGSGTAAAADFTAFGRSLVDDADASAGRSTLGLGSMAVQNASAVAITGGTITGITKLQGTLATKGNTNGWAVGDAWAGAGSDARVDAWASFYKVLSTASTTTTTEQTLFVGAKVQASTPFSQKGAIYAQVQNYASDTGSDAADAVGILSQCYGQATNSANWAFTGDVVLAAGMEGWCFGMELGVYILGAGQAQSSLTADYQKGNLWLGASNGSSYPATFGVGFAAGYWYHGIAMQGCLLDFIRLRNPQQAACRGFVFEDSGNWGVACKWPSSNSMIYSDGASGEKNLVAWTNTNITIGNSTTNYIFDFTAAGLGQRTIFLGANGTGPGGVGHALYVIH